MTMTRKKIEEFRECLREERFYDAHEALEEIWFPRRFEENAEVKLLKGFINAAVSFELLKKGRIPQSKKVWLNYLKYRQLLFKIDSPYLNEYYQLSRTIESLCYNYAI
ncbi:MAG TPA: DUF309 domain-containing protein [Sulfurimonas autotrophica]|uniref:DUF309 domain-containing protein n=1 Tax=Sulfurimonas autotrophica TaxID=202747 RepID=A0A7C3GIA8_9BACT|nr:DUF309 domain-containing protein [Sulfurimonas autotrophica]